MQRLFICLSTFSIILIGVTCGHSKQYWAKTIGGSGFDYAQLIQQTNDGGHIIRANTNSFGAGGADFWILKLDENGNISWQKTYGGEDNDNGRFIQQISNGAYILMGITSSFTSYERATWMLKLNNDGDVLWQRTYAAPGEDDCSYSFLRTTDGGYIISGPGGTLDYPPYSHRAWVMKLDINGYVTWRKRYNGPQNDELFFIQQTQNGEYIAVGRTNSFGAGDDDIWVLKLDSNGDILWQKTYGGSAIDYPRSLIKTSDGEFLISATTQSFGTGENDLWLIKLNGDGIISWQKTYGGNDSDTGYCQQTADGRYIVVGYTFSDESWEYDIWVIEIDSTGSLIWERTFVGIDDSRIYSLSKMLNGDYLVVGMKGNSAYTNKGLVLLKLNISEDIAECGYVETSNFIVSDTQIEGQNSNATVEISSVTVTTTNIAPQETFAETEFLCCYDTEDNDNDCILQEEDNCPNHHNTTQEDNCPPQGNDIGDACDCEGDFDCDGDCDGTDAAIFKIDFGRSTFDNPCEMIDPCNGDFDCDQDCDGTDASLFKEDFGRSQFNNPCPACEVGEWCMYE